ncbi:AbfB domain-containing protein [Deinococcus sp.]|uniref:AbfB domain-containing protein n=1 Tax=Deinococcus sp. TaxID=47478 RepID=UPI003B598E82
MTVHNVGINAVAALSLAFAISACNTQTASSPPATAALSTQNLDIGSQLNRRVNKTISLLAVFPNGISTNGDGYLRHAFGLAYTLKKTTGLSDLEKKDATWKVVKGLSDPECFSFESVNFPGEYLRHANYRIRKDPYKDDPLFKNDATWCEKVYEEEYAVALESKNYPGLFMRRINGEVWLAKPDGTHAWDDPTNFEENTKWYVFDAL